MLVISISSSSSSLNKAAFLARPGVALALVDLADLAADLGVALGDFGVAALLLGVAALLLGVAALEDAPLREPVLDVRRYKNKNGGWGG